MAFNSSNGNSIGATDGPKFFETPPPVSKDVLSQAQQTTSSTDLKGAEHASGQDKTQQESTGPEAEMKQEMEGLGRSEVAKRG